MEKECSKECSTYTALFHHHKYIDIDVEKKDLPFPLNSLADKQTAPNNIKHSW